MIEAATTSPYPTDALLAGLALGMTIGALVATAAWTRVIRSDRNARISHTPLSDRRSFPLTPELVDIVKASRMRSKDLREQLTETRERAAKQIAEIEKDIRENHKQMWQAIETAIPETRGNGNWAISDSSATGEPIRVVEKEL